MDNIPLSVQLSALAVLLLLSGLFSLAETAMMASNRFRLRHQAQEGHRGAKLAMDLLNRTDQLLGVILLGNNLINAAAATLVALITTQLFGENEWALGGGTLAVTFAILVFSEITPKVIGANHADRLVIPVAYVLTPMLKGARPVVWFVNLFVSALLTLLRLKPKASDAAPKLSQEELHSLVLESAHLIPKKHQTILSNLFALNSITVEDVMTPRGNIEILNLAQPWEDVQAQLSTSHHSRLPVCMESLDQLIGVLPLRRLIGAIEQDALNEESLREHLNAPYYIPAGTAAFAQLAFFQENRQRIGFVVDEYGEILGLLTLEDIMEEIVGQFTTSLPDHSSQLQWDNDGCAVVDGSRALREINRQLGIELPTDGPKTLNGLILERFEDIPEAGVSLRIDGITLEVVQTRDRSVRTAKLFRPE